MEEKFLVAGVWRQRKNENIFQLRQRRMKKPEEKSFVDDSFYSIICLIL